MAGGILAIVLIVLFGLSAVGSVIFSVFVIVKILTSREKKADKMKKMALSLPAPLLSVWLLDTFIEMVRFGGIGILYMSIIGIPVHLSFIGSIFLICKILKGNTTTREWSYNFKAAYIIICMIALFCFYWVMSIFIYDLFGVLV